MFISVDEFIEMGYECQDRALGEKCIKRAGYALNSMTCGRAGAVLNGGGVGAELVKQACAVQANIILEAEKDKKRLEEQNSQSSESSSNKNDERFTIGDFTYSSGVSQSNSVKNSSKSASDTGLAERKTVAGLLTAAGCFCAAAEVRE